MPTGLLSYSLFYTLPLLSMMKTQLSFSKVPQKFVNYNVDHSQSKFRPRSDLYLNKIEWKSWCLIRTNLKARAFYMKNCFVHLIFYAFNRTSLFRAFTWITNLLINFACAILTLSYVVRKWWLENTHSLSLSLFHSFFLSGVCCRNSIFVVKKCS